MSRCESGVSFGGLGPRRGLCLLMVLLIKESSPDGSLSRTQMGIRDAQHPSDLSRRGGLGDVLAGPPPCPPPGGSEAAISDHMGRIRRPCQWSSLQELRAWEYMAALVGSQGVCNTPLSPRTKGTSP